VGFWLLILEQTRRCVAPRVLAPASPNPASRAFFLGPATRYHEALIRNSLPSKNLRALAVLGAALFCGFGAG
jgi:hypothetical protein